MSSTAESKPEATPEGPRFSIHTLGCRANQADSEQLAQILTAAGFVEVPFGEPADCQIVNTCTVTREADRKSAQMVRRASVLGEQVVVTGCGAARRGGVWQRVPSTVLRLPPDEREDILRRIGAEHCPSAAHLEQQLPLARRRTRALLRIQDGCDQFCTFCIVPYVRGRARSRPLEQVVDEVARLASLGTREVVLSGIHLSTWGHEEGLTLVELLQALLDRTEGLRFRLSSVEPDHFPSGVIDLMIRNPERLCPSLHLVLQHASDRLLEAMHRGYNLEHYDRLARRFLSEVPGASLSSDIMVGFPGETEADHKVLMGYLRSLTFSRLHIFPYSPRPGTAAARFPHGVAPELQRQRRDQLLRLAQRKQLQFQRQSLGQVREALIESPAERAGWMKATTDNFLPLWVRAPESRRGELMRVELQRRRGEVILACPV